MCYLRGVDGQNPGLSSQGSWVVAWAVSCGRHFEINSHSIYAGWISSAKMLVKMFRTPYII